MSADAAPAIADYIAAARTVAPEWGLVPNEITLLNHAENVVLRLDLADGGRAVMRLHRPGYNTLDELESEVQWVEALAEAGLPVPSAMALADGSGHYREVAIGAERRFAGVVHWIDGRPLGSPLEGADEPAEVLLERFSTIGELTATIRAHGERWNPPAAFTRRRWDADAFVGDNPLWGRFWDVEALTADQRTLFVEARDVLRGELGGLSLSADRFGLIHADLHAGNVMADGDRLTLIDFDDSGWGWYSFELAVAINTAYDEPYYDDALAALLAGYRSVRPIGDDEVAMIDTFLVMRGLMVVGWVDARPELEYHQYLPDIAADAEAACRIYLADR